MGDILVGRHERRLLLVPRSGSHSLVAGWMLQHEPNSYALWASSGQTAHLAQFLSNQEISDPGIIYLQLAVVVRNPIERFRSMIAHRKLDINQQLLSPLYAALPKLPYTRYFLFETQLQECANWLGITTPLPHLDETAETDKPTLTPEQETRVREIYADDVALWESLQP